MKREHIIKKPAFICGLISLFLCLSICNSVSSQITFEKSFGGSFLDGAGDVIQTSDGGYLICGYANNSANGYPEIYLIKTNAYGDTMWTKKYGGVPEGQVGLAVIETANHHFVVTGYLGYIYFHSEVLLLNTDFNGNQQWLYTYDISGYDYGLDVHQTADGGFIISGQEQTSAMLLKTDSAGIFSWKSDGFPHKMGGGGLYGGGMAITNDGGFAFTAFNQTDFDLQFFKTNSSGSTQIHKTYTGYSPMQTLARDPSGGFVLAGGGSGGFNVIKLNDSGDMLWQKFFADSLSATSYSIVVNQNEEIIICGKGRDSSGATSDFSLLNISSGGSENWRNYFGEEGKNDVAYSVIATADGGYALTGIKNRNGVGNSDIYFFKTNPEGEIISGIESMNIENEYQLSIFPSPVNNDLSLSIKSAVFDEARIFDVTGRMVREIRFFHSSAIHSIDASDLTCGLYFIQALGHNKVLAKGNFVKQ